MWPPRCVFNVCVFLYSSPKKHLTFWQPALVRTFKLLQQVTAGCLLGLNKDMNFTISLSLHVASSFWSIKMHLHLYLAWAHLKIWSSTRTRAALESKYETTDSLTSLHHAHIDVPATPFMICWTGLCAHTSAKNGFHKTTETKHSVRAHVRTMAPQRAAGGAEKWELLRVFSHRLLCHRSIFAAVNAEWGSDCGLRTLSLANKIQENTTRAPLPFPRHVALPEKTRSRRVTWQTEPRQFLSGPISKSSISNKLIFVAELICQSQGWLQRLKLFKLAHINHLTSTCCAEKQTGGTAPPKKENRLPSRKGTHYIWGHSNRVF